MQRLLGFLGLVTIVRVNSLTVNQAVNQTYFLTGTKPHSSSSNFSIYQQNSYYYHSVYTGVIPPHNGTPSIKPLLSIIDKIKATPTQIFSGTQNFNGGQHVFSNNNDGHQFSSNSTYYKFNITLSPISNTSVGNIPNLIPATSNNAGYPLYNSNFNTQPQPGDNLNRPRPFVNMYNQTLKPGDNGRPSSSMEIYNTDNKELVQVPAGSFGNVSPIRTTTRVPELLPSTDSLSNAVTTGGGLLDNNYINFANSLGTFSLNLLRTVSSGDNLKNVVLSPFGISTLLSLLLLTIDGRAKIQIENALQVSSKNNMELFRAVTTSLRKNRVSKSDFEVANAIFVEQAYTINEQFNEVGISSFAAEVLTAPFRTPNKAASEINSWVASRTKNKITEIITADNIYNGLQIVLANAMYFRGIWKFPFNTNRTSVRTFNTQFGQKVSAQFMNQQGLFNVGENRQLGARWLEMPFDGDEFSMLIILPTQPHGLDTLMDVLKGADVLMMLTGEPQKAVISIPKFTLTTSTSLVQPLKKLGITDIFNQGTNQGSNSISASSLVVSEAIHRAEISIDEAGSSAVAASIFVANTLSANYDDSFAFRANEPFLAIIIDQISKVPLFVSIVTNPSA